MAVDRVDRLRRLMGEEVFEDETRKGVVAKAEAEENMRIAQAETEKQSLKIEAELEQIRQDDNVNRDVAFEKEHSDSEIKVQYASIEEIRSMIRPRTVDPLAVGEQSEPGMEFCPILALAKYPYKYMTPQSEDSERVSKKYFANERFWNREWSLAFIDRINKSLGFGLSLEGSRKTGLVISFPDDGNPRPRFLGISNSKQLFTAYEKSVPQNMDQTKDVSDRSFQAWKKKIEQAMEAIKQRKSKNKQKKLTQRLAEKTVWARQLRRLQRYLGLRAENSAERKNAYFLASTSEEQDAISQARAFAREDGTPVIDVNEKPEYPFDLDVVFVAVDVEVYEKNHRQITEIGIATLDTASLMGTPPGQLGTNWIGKVKARHFIIKEYAHLVNSKYVAGCPNRFEEQFGKSEELSIDDAKATIQSCLESAHDGEGHARTVILVGHDIESDVNFLHAINLDIKNVSGVLEVLDTSSLYRSMMREDTLPSLSSVLYTLGITGWNLHNAGNDAGYTLQALLAMGVRSVSPASKSPSLEEQIEKAKSEAEERVRETAAEWDQAEEESESGGVPIETEHKLLG